MFNRLPFAAVSLPYRCRITAPWMPPCAGMEPTSVLPPALASRETGASSVNQGAGIPILRVHYT